MLPTETPVDEADRLRALLALQILDSVAEDEFDGLVKAASVVCGTPISLLTLIDSERQWFKAKIGLAGVLETPREVSFCAEAVQGEGIFEVSDAAADPRFQDHALVKGEPKIRFYAGAPIRLSSGHQVGAVCVIDGQPRSLNESQRQVLRCLAMVAAKMLECRKALMAQNRVTASLQDALRDVAAGKDLLRRSYEATPAMLQSIDTDGRLVTVSDAWLDRLGYTRDEVIGRRSTEFLTPASSEYARSTVLPAFFETGRCRDIAYQMVTKDGSLVDVLLSGFLHQDASGRPVSLAALSDVTLQKAAEQRLAESEARYRGLVEDQSELVSLATPEGSLLFVNDAYARQYQRDPDQMLGRNLFEFIPEKAQAAVSEDLRRVCESDEIVRNENQILLPDGRTRWIAWTNRAIRDGAGRLTIHSVGRDIEERVAAEQQIKESEARFRLLSESSPHGVFSAAADGSCEYCNVQWRTIFGLSEDQALGTGWLSAVHMEDTARVLDGWKEAAERKQALDIEFRIVHPDGDVRQVQMRARPILHTGGDLSGFVGSAEDITERRAILRELAAGRDNFRRLYEATPAMLHSIDASGRLLMVSDAWLAKLGYRRDEVIGRASTDFLTAASCHACNQVAMPAFFASGRTENLSVQMVAKDGAVIDVLMSAALERDDFGQPLRSFTILEDVTARLEAERALRDSEARYRMLADTTSDVITQLDLDLVRRYVSPACLSVLGYEAHEMLGVTPSTTIHPDDAPEVSRVMHGLIAGEMTDDKATVTNRMRHKHGHWVWLEAGINLVRDPDSGGPQYLVCSLRDISERRRAAEVLEEGMAATERAARVKAEFMANMSHELRTPLTGILGIHELLQRDLSLGADQRRYLSLAYDAGQSLMAIINDILDFSKIEAGHLKIESVPFDLGALITACHALASEQAAKKSLAIEIRSAGCDAMFLGDPVRLRQILLNLLTNAVKFTERGKVVIQAVHSAPHGRLRLTVTDTGIGIAADQLSSIFERFSQADGSTTRRYGGTGLGLAICKQLVASMNGEITVTSAVGQGSTFSLDLPLPLAEPAKERSPQPQTGGSAARRVLLAEDNLLNQMIITEMLKQRGHAVTVVDNGAAAVSIMEAGQAFDVVLMDLQMPVLDGFSATRSIRALQADDHRPPTPIIGLTASTMDEDRARCREVGMDAHVAKPIEWPALFTAMDNVASTPFEPEAPADAPLVLDTGTLDTLQTIIGRDRLAAMLHTFIDEIRRQVTGLDQLTEPELSRFAHGWTSMAGHFGFVELQQLSSAVEAEARVGTGRRRVGDLRGASSRAIAAAQACGYLNRVA